MTISIEDYENIKTDLEQSYHTLRNYPVTFPPHKPSPMEKRLAIFETSPNLTGAVTFVSQEQNLIQSALPEQCVNHFKEFQFPPDDLWNGPTTHPCTTPPYPVKSMITINKCDQKVPRFDFLRTSITFDLTGLMLCIETSSGSCSDIQIILNDARIDVVALLEEVHRTDLLDMTGSYCAYIVRHYNRTFHLPHSIEHKQASIKQEGNVMCVFIPWK